MFNTKHSLLREMAGLSPHIRNLLPVAAVMIDALDQVGISYGPHRVRQLAIGADHIGKFQHADRQAGLRSRITIVRRDGTAYRDYFSVADAIAFHQHTRLP